MSIWKQQQINIFLSLGLIDVVSDVSTISSYMTTISSTWLFTHLWSFNYSLSQSLLHSRRICSWDSKHNLLRISNVLLFFTLTMTFIPFLFWVTFLTIKFTSAFTWIKFCECPWFSYLIDHIKFFQVYFYNINRNTGICKNMFLPDESSTVLQLPSHLFILMMNS